MPAPLPIGDAEAAALFEDLSGAARLVVAVSGGPDSLALMLLMARWAAAPDRPALHIATVDHAVREASRQEAETVVGWAGALGLSAEAIHLPPRIASDHAALRDARYGALAEAARRAGASHVVTAHHHDDQAETVLLRLARGSGLRGLRGMLPMRTLGDGGLQPVILARPLLGVRPDRLRATCEAGEHPWIEDPSNSDPRYARAQMRDLRPDLDAVGLTSERLVAAADGFSRANAALDHYAAKALETLEITPIGLVGLPRERFDEPEDVARRIVETLLDIVRGGLPYPPRLERVLRIERWLRSGGAGRRVLQGCVVTAPEGGGIVTVHREWGRAGLPGFTLAPGETIDFDNRYVIAGGVRPVTIRGADPGMQLERPSWVSAQAWREGCLAAPVVESDGRVAWLSGEASEEAPTCIRDRVDTTWRTALAAIDRR